MYPNTFMMQELVRQDFDEVLGREEEGQQVEMPYIYSVRRGKSALPTLCSRPRGYFVSMPLIGMTRNASS